MCGFSNPARKKRNFFYVCNFLMSNIWKPSGAHKTNQRWSSVSCQVSYVICYTPAANIIICNRCTFACCHGNAFIIHWQHQIFFVDVCFTKFQIGLHGIRRENIVQCKCIIIKRENGKYLCSAEQVNIKYRNENPFECKRFYLCYKVYLHHAILQ